MSVEALEGLRDPDRHPFPPEHRAALGFADAMTRGSGEVPDETFEELRRHFSEPQIVEIAAVIGIFNYFNRFNNALRTDITLADPDLLARRIEEAVASAAGAGAACERAATILAAGRRYPRVAIHRRRGERSERLALAAPQPAGTTRSRLRVPIGSEGNRAGTIEAASDTEAGFDDEDRALLERVASLLAPLIAPDR
ncbi:MAG: hypothetical protein ACE5JH_02985 [Acidobacteriota bacterium]